MRQETADMISLLEWAEAGNFRVTSVEPGRIEMTDAYGWVEFTLRAGPELTYGQSHDRAIRTYLSSMHSLGSTFIPAADHPPQR